MSKWFNKGVDLEITLHDPPIFNKYSPVDKSIKGDISIHCKEQLKKVSSVKYGVVGTIETFHYIDQFPGGPLQMGNVNRVLVTDSVTFFNTFSELDLNGRTDPTYRAANDNVNNGREIHTLNPGETFKVNFEFELPPSQYLPSSVQDCSNFDCGFSINYKVYIEIYKVGGLLGKNPRVSSSTYIPILYQSAAAYTPFKNLSVLKYIDTKLFVNKVKKFYYDKEKNALIPSSLDKAHTKTKFIRKLWDNKYRDENYKSTTKSIPLTLDFQTKTYIDMSLPLSSQFKLTVKSDIKSVGINSNQELDFVFNNQSTKLGLFQIESLKIHTIHSTNFVCRDRMNQLVALEEGLKIGFSNLVFDLKDFEYDKSEEIYKFDIPIETLVSSCSLDLNDTLSNLVGTKTVLCSGEISSIFASICKVKFTWKISDGMFQKKEFEFNTTSTCDFLVDQAPGNFINYEAHNFIPPPIYDMRKADEELWSSTDIK